MDILSLPESANMATPHPATADHSGQPPGQLTSWKEIAGYFHVSVRTAQRWERSLRLPVKRRPGRKGRIFANQNDLSNWLDNIPATERTRVLAASFIYSPFQQPEETSPPRSLAGIPVSFSAYYLRARVRMLGLLTAMLKPGLWSVWPRLRSHQRG